MTRRLPLVVYVRRCVKLLEGPHTEISILGTGACVHTAVLVAQDVVSIMGGKVTFEAAELPPCFRSTPSSKFISQCGNHNQSITLEGKARSVFTASAARLSEACAGKSQCVRLAMHVRTKTVEASDECIEVSELNMMPSGGDEMEAELLNAGINRGTTRVRRKQAT